MTRAWILLLYDVILVRLAIEDFKKRKISTKYSAAILVLSIVSLTMIQEISVGDRLLGMFAVSIPLLILAILLPGSFGGGDVKLICSCGAFLGWQKVLKGTMYAVLFAGIYCLWLIYVKKEYRNEQIAFGPFLSLGYGIVSFQLFDIL